MIDSATGFSLYESILQLLKSTEASMMWNELRDWLDLACLIVTVVFHLCQWGRRC